MKIKDIVEMSAVLLQLDDVLNLNIFTGNTGDEVVETITAHNLNLLVRCANLSLSVLVTDKFRLKKVETISTETGEIKFDDFSKNVFEVLEVSLNGEPVTFRVYPNLLDCFKKGTYKITYDYIPDFKYIDEDIDDFDKTVPLRIMAYFTASEFSYISGDFEAASAWEQKYKEALESLTSKRSKKVPERRWF